MQRLQINKGQRLANHGVPCTHTSCVDTVNIAQHCMHGLKIRLIPGCPVLDHHQPLMNTTDALWERLRPLLFDSLADVHAIRGQGRETVDDLCRLKTLSSMSSTVALRWRVPSPPNSSSKEAWASSSGKQNSCCTPWFPPLDVPALPCDLSCEYIMSSAGHRGVCQADALRTSQHRAPELTRLSTGHGHWALCQSVASAW